ncbi:MAG: glycosyltransferase [Gemmataceae bacterium]|nr:glycosyltransferase [Gemmataceae bacterium]MCS7271167.1 glycosyltransferase [Gemmataceae bacterium]MDW8242265.1 glycosyltransferase [Thermogemmata sp.]
MVVTDGFTSAKGRGVVIVHDWLTGMRGGEKCLEPLCRRWPQAQLWTLLYRPGSVASTIEQLRIRPSWLNRLPAVWHYYRYLLPLMPLAAGWRIPRAELVVSFSHAVAKSAQPPPGVPHVCYCFTPMRYAWHLKEAYFGNDPTLDRPATDVFHRLQHGLQCGIAWGRDRILAALREWDRATASRVTHFVAISQTVRQRIRECYLRDATVIYPPVDTDFYTPTRQKRESFYLVVSALAPYKRFDLAIMACNRLRRNLIIIGTGQAYHRLKALAGPTVHFLGWQPDTVVRDYLRRAQALLFPGEEDFGIVPLEAQACGCTVIGFGRGGLTETVLPLDGNVTPTGVFFYEQTVDAVIEAILQWERHHQAFDPAAARRQALRFRRQRYEAELFTFLDAVRQGWTSPVPEVPARQTSGEVHRAAA